jgi:peptidoglycan/LPS O-acetylase OafA/YrhL
LFIGCIDGQTARPLSTPRFVANLLLLDVSMNGTLWALQVELLMVPVILFLYFLERWLGPHILLGIALISTALAYSNRWAVWPPLSTNVFPFVLGMVIPTLGQRFAMRSSGRAGTCWAAGAVTALLLTHPCFGLYSRYSAVVEAYAAATLISLVAYRQDLSVFKCLDAKSLRLVGLASGSYYVLHMATIPAALAIAGALIPPTWSANAPALVGYLVVAAWLLALAPVAMCSYYLVESPGIALGRHVVRFCRLDSRPASSTCRESVVPALAT